MSDDYESESIDDFSASEDEWTPAKLKDVEVSEDDEEELSNTELDDEFAASPPKKKKLSNASSSKGQVSKRGAPKRASKSNAPSLRAKMFKKYKPPPKTISTTTRPINTSISSKKTEDSDSDSGSSVENFLVNPEKIDLKSSFFDRVQKRDDEKEEQEDEEKPPEFDCNVGISSKNSDDDDNDMESVDEEETKQKSNASEVSPFKQFYDYKKNVDQVKQSVRSINSKSENTVKQDDISSLLALGEATTSKAKETTEQKAVKKPTKKSKIRNSDSEWEEVEEDEIALNEQTKAKDGIEITVGFPEQTRRRDKKVSDEQAQMMRRLNRIIKENCLIFHKVSLLCHIAQGTFVNRSLNNVSLWEAALKLLPSPKSYPNGRTCIKYFESIAKWYKATIQLKSDSVYSNLKNKPPIPVSLALQIKSKAAICKRDFVLMFIVLLRAMGIQCRLVINLVALPIRPASDDLCSLKTKKPEDPKSGAKAANKPKSKAQTNQSNKNVSEKQSKANKSKGKKTAANSSFDSSEEEQNNRKAVKVEIKSEKLKENKFVPEIRITKLEEFDTKAESNLFSPVKTRTQRKIKQDNQTNSLDVKKEPAKSGKSSAPSNRNRSPSPKFNISPNFLKSEKVENLFSNKQNTRPTRSKKEPEKGPAESRNPSPKLAKPSASGRDAKAATATKKKLSLKEKLKIPQLDGADSIPKRRGKEKVKDNVSDSDSDFVGFGQLPAKQLKVESKLLSRVKNDRRVLSTDDENSIQGENKKPKNKKTMDIWVEVYSEEEDQWVSIDLFKTKIHCADSLRKDATQPVSYVFAWNNDNSLKDVSPRYCPQWNTVTRKQRVEKEWLEKAIRKYLGAKSSRDVAEDRELEKIHMDKPLPTTINEFKNHPLYALERHLLKFEAIYPPNAPTLGFVRGEPIYPRDCIHTLHSRDIWLKVAKVVKPAEKPYKIVTARPKWDRATSSVIKDQPLEIFGFWQTMDYDPPTAENGIVPRNAYGNVELFKPTMLPKKTVHIQLPGLNRVCKKLKIDCAQAVVGFDFHQGACHPLYDGFVVCEEYKDQVIAAWEDDQEEQARKEVEKFEARVYGNWKRLIKGLLIRERLKIKYNLFDDAAMPDKPKLKRKK